ncbi:MAG: 60S ribosomal protein L22 [Candidatus Ranarchaeia archaeon]
MSNKKTIEPNEVKINCMGISSGLVKDLKKQVMSSYGEDVSVKISGKNITLSSSEQNISKSKLRLVLKRFLHKQKLRMLVKIISSGKDGLKLYRPGFKEDEE